MRIFDDFGGYLQKLPIFFISKLGSNIHMIWKPLIQDLSSLFDILFNKKIELTKSEKLSSFFEKLFFS